MEKNLKLIIKSTLTKKSAQTISFWIFYFFTANLSYSFVCLKFKLTNPMDISNNDNYNNPIITIIINVHQNPKA